MRKEEIIKELLQEEEVIKVLQEVPEEESALLHFSLGMYIRNKYIWGNFRNYYMLANQYNKVDADGISSCIIKDLYKVLKNKK